MPTINDVLIAADTTLGLQQSTIGSLMASNTNLSSQLAASQAQVAPLQAQVAALQAQQADDLALGVDSNTEELANTVATQVGLPPVDGTSVAAPTNTTTSATSGT